MKKIFIHTPFGKDANSFWRCMGPMSYLAKHSEGEIQIQVAKERDMIHWDTLDQMDLLFMHRPCTRNEVILLQIARNLNIPVWVDYDDWLFHLPDWNPHHRDYHDSGVQNAVAAIIACADVVTCSTQALAKEFLEINKNTIIVPNAYRSDLFPYRKKEVPERKPIYAWRGTNTHEGDLLSVEAAFLKLPEKVHFMGGPSYSLLSKMPQDKYSTGNHVDVIQYWKAIHDLAPKVLLFPLKEHFFNRCKSNIAWIEATHAGALTVAPNWDEWNHPGVFNYDTSDPTSFLDAAEYAIGMDDDIYRNQQKISYDYMRAKYDISVVNQIRQNILSAIFSPGFERSRHDPLNQLTSMWALSILKKQPLPRAS